MSEEQKQFLKETIYEAVNQSHQHFSKSISDIGSVVFKKETSMDKIRKNWMIIIFFVSLSVTVIASWARLTQADVVHDSRITVLEARTASIESSNTQILSQLSQIQTDLAWIKNIFDNKR